MAEETQLPEPTKYLISVFDTSIIPTTDQKISVNPVVAEVATWYEKFRNVMDYREDDAILRAAVERILKRRLLLSNSGKSIASPLVRELVWARYFPDATVPEGIITQIASTIDLYLSLQTKIPTSKGFSKKNINEWIIQILSSQIYRTLNPDKEKETLVNFIYHYLKQKIKITDDTEETRDVQVFIAIRRAFAKEDLALLRYHLFIQYFGFLTAENLDFIAQNFKKGYEIIQQQLSYPLKDKIYSIVKNQTIPFFILEDVLTKFREQNLGLIKDQERFHQEIDTACLKRYSSVIGNVRRAIVRGVIFILLTKALIALAVEGSYESLTYGTVSWGSIAINTFSPPILMLAAGLFIKTPGKENSQKIYKTLESVLYYQKFPGNNFELKKASTKINPLMNLLFVSLWLLAFAIGFGTMIFILTKLHFNFVSQGVFIFFLTIVSFISYRINQTAHMYTMEEQKQNIGSVLFDFFFTPFISLGRHLTEGVSQINLLLFIFDFIIETPFKGIFAFFEQWFLFLRSQREKLG